MTVLAALFGVAVAGECSRARREDPPPAWLDRGSEPVVLGEVAVTLWSFAAARGGSRRSARNAQRNVAGLRDAFLAGLQAAGSPVVPLASHSVSARWGSCPYFPPVPVVPGRCPFDTCRPVDTRTDRCGFGAGPGVPVDAALALHVVAWPGVSEEGEPEAWDFFAALERMTPGSVAPSERVTLSGRVEAHPGCDVAELAAWVSLGADFAAALAAPGRRSDPAATDPP